MAEKPCKILVFAFLPIYFDSFSTITQSVADILQNEFMPDYQ